MLDDTTRTAGPSTSPAVSASLRPSTHGQAPEQTKPAAKRDWLLPASLIALSLVPVVAGAARVAELAGGQEITAQNARFFANPVPVVLHIVSASVFSLLGAFQFSRGFRRRRPGWHRAAGRVLAPLGLLAAASGLWMTLFYPFAAPDGMILYFMRLVVGSAMVGCICLAVLALPRRDYAAHGAWMTRGYAIGLGAGTQVFTHLPWLLIGGEFNEYSRALLMGAGWAINIVVAEWAIRKESRARVGRVGSAPALRP